MTQMQILIWTSLVQEQILLTTSIKMSNNVKSNDVPVNGEGGDYWKLRYEELEKDYDRLHKLNQVLEDRILNITEDFQKQKEQIIATVEHEKSTLMADVNKLSTKLVDARIKLHDFEEQQLLRRTMDNDPNLV